MAIPVILSRNGVSVYPATIPEAIIDPETGEPAKIGTDMEYTINNQQANENGNFTITAQSIGAATSNHQHEISDISGLAATLNTKAASNHTHVMVNSVQVAGNASTITGPLTIQGTGNVSVTKTGANSLQISVSPYVTDIVGTVQDANSSNDAPIAIFTGTQEEWDEFASSNDMLANRRYLVIIRS